MLEDKKNTNQLFGTCPTVNLVIDDDVNFHIANFLLVNNEIEINTDYIRVKHGETYLNYLNNPYFFYSGDRKFLEIFFKTNDLSLIAIKFCDLVTSFLSFLWLIKDNSINIRRLVLFDNYSGVHNRKLISFTTSSGEFKHTKFNQDEIKKAVSIYNKFNEISTTKLDPLPATIKKGDFVSMESFAELYNSYSRITKSYHFIVSSRAESKLINKISFMISSLECLFSTKKVRITAQLRLRVSQYLGKDEIEKKEIKDCINRAYDIRSRYFHGDKVSNKFNSRDKILPITMKLDSILRSVFVKVIENDSHYFENKTEFEKFINKLKPKDNLSRE